ncbi:hypothetical protein ACIA5G_51925 [Amycolatopsis sp. NPDC051758]|uniref:hypothetical protein n=1 Tax=Amycolatopsis sp. NPDC051758 TaxID=3363935 RepID=UPI0037888275
MDDVLRASLRAAVYDRLDYLDTIVNGADTRSRVALADSVIPMLTHAWRDLLNEHEPDEHGRCRACSPRRGRRARGCSVWQMAHRHLIPDAGDRKAARTARTPACESTCPRCRNPGAVVTIGILEIAVRHRFVDSAQA